MHGATTACNFSSLIWPAGSAPAALASLLFDRPEPQIIEKNTVFRDFPTFSAHLHLLSSDSFSSLIFFLSSNLSLLSASALLCFSSVHIVGSLTSKLPSINVSFCLSIYLSASLKTKLFLNLTTSKTLQFCETSSIFELDNVKNSAILRDFLHFQVDHIKNEAMLRDFLNARS